MCKIKWLIIFLLLITSEHLCAQRVRVNVQFNVIADSTVYPLADRMAYVVGSTETFFTDYKGNATFLMNRGDSIKIFIQEYATYTLRLKDSVYKKEYNVSCLFTKPTYTTKEVVIKPLKNFDELDKELKELLIVPKNLQKPEISLSSPISALYETFSKNAQEREKLRGQVSENARRSYLNDLYKFYNYHHVTNLDESEFDDFSAYHKLPLTFFVENTFYDICVTISQFYKQYRNAK